MGHMVSGVLLVVLINVGRVWVWQVGRKWDQGGVRLWGVLLPDKD